jgi:Domain of unknown function (DUF6285)
MRIRPTGYELLATACTLLCEHLLPCVPPGEQQTMRDIEHAMVLAARNLELDRPAGPEDLELLNAARVALRGKLLEQLPADRRYDARLVAKTIAIATSELANGTQPERAELDELAALLHKTPQTDVTAGDVRRQLAMSYERLCADIRSGSTDPGMARYPATLAHLRAITLRALSESNPGYLSSHPRPALAGHDGALTS